MITGKNLDTGANLQEFIEQECNNVVEKYIGEKPIDMNITVSKDSHNKFHIEGKIHLSKKLTIHCKSSDDDAYKAVSQLTNHVEARIQKYKSRLRDRKRRADFDALKAAPVGYYVIDSLQSHETEEAPLVIAEASKDLNEMTVSDAVMQMDLSGQQVFVFKNAAHGSINVLYKRDDGNVGWIDPTKKLNA